MKDWYFSLELLFFTMLLHPKNFNSSVKFLSIVVELQTFMQASNSRPGSLDAPQKASLVMSRTVQKLKIPGSESDPALSPDPVSKTSRNRSPKVVGRQSPRSPANEKKKPSRVSELESQIAQLEEELKKAKDRLSSPMSLRQSAQQESEEAKEQLAAMSIKLEETQKQLKELSDSEEARLQELRKISQDRDRAWESELEALKKQHSMDSSALASATNEIHNLKIQLDRVSGSEVSHARHAESACVEIQRLRCELNGRLELVEKLKTQLNNTREAEARAVKDVSRAQTQLKDLKITEETLHSKHAIAMESYKNLILELEVSKNRVVSLEETVRSLQSNLGHHNKISVYPFDDVKTEVPKNELMELKHEVDRLRSALKNAERRHQDEYNRSALEINNANELLENVKSESFKKQLEIEAKIKEYRVKADILRAKLTEKDNALKSISHNKGLSLKSDENAPAERESELETELDKSESLLKDLQACLLEKETQLQTIREENKILKSEISKNETERNEATNEAIALTEASRAAEQEALIKIGYLTEESKKCRRKTMRATEQLDATQAANVEIETELRRLKVQSDQWRKAAEAAAAMLSLENNGKYVKRTGSLDYLTISGKLGSPYYEDIDDDFGKKKNGNMLKKIGGVLLKKGQK
ncbi:interactor of constitutive active ROPs 2, chloroplastic-like isoform X1 [Primulina tabacum]|uniref:interactor of constitutive active ROPs 2, chloroplastic-like isoform X1 n=2 Tax=Primulina tabacum TaxID=48773 RepID=UPI003F5A4893